MPGELRRLGRSTSPLADAAGHVSPATDRRPHTSVGMRAANGPLRPPRGLRDAGLPISSRKRDEGQRVGRSCGLHRDHVLWTTVKGMWRSALIFIVEIPLRIVIFISTRVGDQVKKMRLRRSEKASSSRDTCRAVLALTAVSGHACERGQPQVQPAGPNVEASVITPVVCNGPGENGRQYFI